MKRLVQLVVAAMAGVTCLYQSIAAPSPNILFIYTDDHSHRSISCYEEAYDWGVDLFKKGYCDGFNIGQNIGESAGQTVMYPHIHLIPRTTGDCEDPRGGVRGVIPEKQKY